MFTSAATLIDEKIANLTIAKTFRDEMLYELQHQFRKIDENTKGNNQKIQELNFRKNRIDEESKTVRRDLCKVVFNDIVKQQKPSVDNLSKLERTILEMDKDIREKEEKQKVGKKEKVFKTVGKVLEYFFGDKYSLDETTFRLIINRKVLDEGQAKDVLSQGEKNVIAFAYFMGDIHCKVNKEDDYNNLFLVIDDPISSMDFNHVYSVSGVLRNLKDIINGGRERFIIFTHNMDFMRVLVGNSIVCKSYLLKDATLKEFNNSLTVPYINHLHDIFKIAKKISPPTHTTANSIRHIIETLNKFENIDCTNDLISQYIKENISSESRTYTLINDLSHGGWRSEQLPIHDDDYVIVCEAIVELINKKYKGQIDYCSKLN